MEPSWYRKQYCDLGKFQREHPDIDCWQHDYLFRLFCGDDKAMLKVCIKCIYFKKEKVNERI